MMQNDSFPDNSGKPNESPFQAPHGYFESVENKLVLKIKEKNAPQPFGYWKPVFAMASMFILLSFGIYIYQQNTFVKKQDPTAMLESISNEEKIEYLVSMNYSTGELIDLVEASSLTIEDQDLDSDVYPHEIDSNLPQF